MTPLRLFAVLILLPASFPARAADDAGTGWVLTTANFRSVSVTLKSIDPSGVRVVADPVQQVERLVGMDDFLQLERPLPASIAAAQQGKVLLHLACGDQVAGDPGHGG